MFSTRNPPESDTLKNVYNRLFHTESRLIQHLLKGIFSMGILNKQSGCTTQLKYHVFVPLRVCDRCCKRDSKTLRKHLVNGRPAKAWRALCPHLTEKRMNTTGPKSTC